MGCRSPLAGGLVMGVQSNAVVSSCVYTAELGEERVTNLLPRTLTPQSLSSDVY